MKCRNVIYLALFLLCSSCYKDEGNYCYDEEIKGIEVSLEKAYAVKKEKTDFTITIEPKIELNGENRALSYAWYRSTRSTDKGQQLSTERNLTLTFKPQSSEAKDRIDSEYFLRLYVTDKSNNTVTMRHTRLFVADPYSGAWAVLHEQDGHAEIGTIEYIGGNLLVAPNTYSKEQGQALIGRPHHLGVRLEPNGYTASNWLYSIQTQLYLTTSHLEEGGLLAPGDNFLRRSSWKTLLSEEEQALFKPDNITGSGAGDRGYAFSSGGKVWANNPYSPVCYQAYPDEQTTGGTGSITHLAVLAQVGVGFDELNRRLVRLDITNHNWRELEAKNPAPRHIFYDVFAPHGDNRNSPDNIPASYKPVAFFPGYQYGTTGIAPYQQYQVYCYFIDGNMSHVYTIRGRELTAPQAEASISGFYSFAKPEALTEDSPMTTGFKYNNIVFYASGHKVYKHNIVTGEAKVIYTHRDATAQAKSIKMAVEGYLGNATYQKKKQAIGSDPEKCLAIGFNIGTGGEVVVLNLDTSGDVRSTSGLYPNVQVHKGFGPITSVVFI